MDGDLSTIEQIKREYILERCMIGRKMREG